MIIEFGHLLFFAALGFSVLQAIYGFLQQMHIVKNLAGIIFFMVLTGFITLIIAFLNSDFSLALAAAHSHTQKPLIYKIAGVWANHEGSMALWCLVMVGYGAFAAWRLPTDRPQFIAYVLAVQACLCGLSIAYLLFASNPFLRLDPAPLQGEGLNPLLQDPALALHPPMLYLGYVGFSFVFSLAAAALLEGRADQNWARITRPYVLTAWSFLTIGIILGSYWAYYELGWGGWWFWDPVENASFMPWLIGTALLHSIIVLEKRGGFAAWTLLLAILSFCFSLLGAFLVRSGILTSVHAFALDPQRGMILLFGLALIGGAAFLLYGIQAARLPKGKAFDPVSRESALLINNLIIAVSAATLVFGTLFPILMEGVSGEKVSVGPPFFELTLAPIMALAFMLLPIAQVLSWGRAEIGHKIWLQRLLWLMICMSLALLTAQIYGFNLWLICGSLLGLWVGIGASLELIRRLRARLGSTHVWMGLRGLSLRVWGMSLAHIGLGIFIYGAVVETITRKEDGFVMAIGEQATFMRWQITLNSIETLERQNYYAERAQIRVENKRQSFLLKPEKRYYPVRQTLTTETAIARTGLGDLYLVLGEPIVIDGIRKWNVRVHYNPLMDLIFGGASLIALGGIFSLLSRRKQAKPAKVNAQSQIGQPP